MKIRIGANYIVTLPKQFCIDNSIVADQKLTLLYNKQSYLGQMTTQNRLRKIKVFCEENDIKIGDEFYIEYFDNTVVFKVNEDEIYSKVNEKENKEENYNKNKKTNIAVKNDDIAVKNDDIAVKNDNIKLKELAKIPLSGSTEFVPNLIESLSFTNKLYSKCGLLCRTKIKYIQNYCNKCKGQMIAKEVRHLYCPFAEDIEDSVDVSTNISLNVIDKGNEKIIDKKDEVKVDKTEVDVKDISHRRIINDINNNIIQLNKKIDNKIKQLDTSKDVNIYKDDSTMEVVKYSHHHQCYGCSEYYNIGFLVDFKHFYCRGCACNLFKNFMRKNGRLKNV